MKESAESDEQHRTEGDVSFELFIHPFVIIYIICQP